MADSAPAAPPAAAPAAAAEPVDDDIIRWPDEPPPPPEMWEIEPLYDWEREDRGYIFEQRLEAAATHKDAGNAHYRAEEWELALRRYKRAIYCCHFDELQMHDLNDHHKETAHGIQVPCKLNLTACIVTMVEAGSDALPEGSLDHAVLAVSEVLKVRPKEAKAFFRKGQVLMLQQDLAGARAALGEAAALGGGSGVREAFSKLKELERQEKQRQRELYGGRIQSASVHKAAEEKEAARLARWTLAARAARVLGLPLLLPFEALLAFARYLARRLL